MATTTDIREWAKTQGLEVKAKGPLPDDVRARYAAEHAEAEADYPPGPAELEDQAPADVAEAAPPPTQAERTPARPRPTAGERGRAILARLHPQAGTKRDRPRPRKMARVSLANLIEDAWGQMAWAASPLPPMQRLLQAQGPFAGIAMEDALQGTVVDRVLQPVARAEDKAKAVGGLLMPPAALMLVLVTAPAPNVTVDQEGREVATWPEPSIQHKGALMTLRWSLMLWSEAGAARLDEYRQRAEASAERGRQADQFMAWILGFEEPAADEDARAAAEQGTDVISAAVSAEDEAVRRAQAMFGDGQV